MINKINGISFKSEKKLKETDSPIKQDKQNITLPPKPFMEYSASHVHANYMPVSFKGDSPRIKTNNGGKPSTAIVHVNDLTKWMSKSKAKIDIGVKAVSILPDSELIKGSYYNHLGSDIATISGAGKMPILFKESGVDSEILIHSFAKDIKKGKYKGTLPSKETEVIFINNLFRFNTNINPQSRGRDFFGVLEDYVNKNSLKKHKIIFIERFDKVSDNYKSINEVKFKLARLKDKNISIVGLITPEDKFKMKVMKEVYSEFPNLELKGLNSDETKEFLRRNPKYVKNALKSTKNIAKFEFSQKGLESLVDSVAPNSKVPMPKAVLDSMAFVAASAANETKVYLSPEKKFSIKPNHVQNYFRHHRNIVELSKNDSKEVRFSLAENVTTNLSDVGGLNEVKKEIQEDLIEFLKNPKEFIKERGQAPKGILLEGPPGTGKTLLARAIAGETSTPFISASGSDFIEKYVGTGAARIKELFKTAREAAQNAPNKTAIIFIDEIDAVAGKRNAEASNEERVQTINKLLSEMDGFDNKASDTHIVVLAATNRKDMLDSAVIRPGRFDGSHFVDNRRTITDRLEILNIYAKKMKFENEAEKAKILNNTAKMTEGMSGAELSQVIANAKKIVVKRSDNKFVTPNDMTEGFLRVKAGPVNKIPEDVPFEKVVSTVRHEGGHAVLMDFLKPLFDRKISFITLDPRGEFLGAVFTHQPKVNPDFRSIMLSAAVSYGGGLAEPEFNSKGRGAGVSQDLKNATNLFRRAITEWGQGVHTPAIVMDADNNQKGFDTLMMDINKVNIQKDMELFSDTAQNKIAKRVLEFHKGFLNEYVDIFKAKAGQGGNNFSGEAFAKLRHDWLVRTGKVEAEKQLMKEIEQVLDDAFNSNKGILTKAVKKASTVVDSISFKGITDQLTSTAASLFRRIK